MLYTVHVLFSRSPGTAGVVIHLANIHLVLFVFPWVGVLPAGCCQDPAFPAPSVPQTSVLVPPPHCQGDASQPACTQITAPCLSGGGQGGGHVVIILTVCSCRVLGFQLAKCDFVSAFLAADPLPGLEERPASVGASEGAFLKQLPHPAPPLQADFARRSSPQGRGPEGPELRPESSEPGDGCPASTVRSAWLSGSGFASPPAQACTLADLGPLPENGLRVEASPCGSEGKSRAPPEAGPPAEPTCSPLYTPGLEFPSSATRYHVGPGLQPVGPVMGGKPPAPHPPPFPPRAFQSHDPHSGVFPRYRPHQGMRYPYQPPPQPSYHHYPRTPYYSCPQGFSDWPRHLAAPVSPSGPPPAQPTPARPLFPDKSAVTGLQGCEVLSAALTPPARVDAVEALGAALTSPTRVDAVAAKMAEGQNPGPEGKQDESMEQPESPKEFLDLDNHNAAARRQGSLSASECLYGAPPAPLGPGMTFGSPAFPPHAVMLHAGPPYPPQRPATHFQPRAYASPSATHPPHRPVAAQPNGLSPECPLYRYPEEGLGHFQAVMMEQMGPGSGARASFQEMYRPSG